MAFPLPKVRHLLARQVSDDPIPPNDPETCATPVIARRKNTKLVKSVPHHTEARLSLYSTHQLLIIPLASALRGCKASPVLTWFSVIDCASPPTFFHTHTIITVETNTWRALSVVLNTCSGSSSTAMMMMCGALPLSEGFFFPPGQG